MKLFGLILCVLLMALVSSAELTTGKTYGFDKYPHFLFLCDLNCFFCDFFQFEQRRFVHCHRKMEVPKGLVEHCSEIGSTIQQVTNVNNSYTVVVRAMITILAQKNNAKNFASKESNKQKHRLKMYTEDGYGINCVISFVNVQQNQKPC